MQQVVLTGDEADLTALPVHLQHGADGAPYISASIDYVDRSEDRLHQCGHAPPDAARARARPASTSIAPSDLRAIYEASAARRQAAAGRASWSARIRSIIVAAMMRLPVDELGLVASLRGAPLPVVKCVTNDIRVPADAEYVLEGYLDARGHVEPEGPYGEFLGYYGVVKRNPVFHLTAITRRARRAVPDLDHRRHARWPHRHRAAQRACAPRSMSGARSRPRCASRSRSMRTPSSGGMYNVRVSMRQRVPGEARNAIAACFGALANVKNVFVVDPDIDIFSDEQMDWALATRFQADRDLS